MLRILSGLRNVTKCEPCKAESFVFRLHSRVTFLLLMFCCFLVSTSIFSGTKISCHSNAPSEIRVSVLESYCWAASTYSVSSAYLDEVGVEASHPGISSSESESEYIYRNYYQYLHLVLFIQAMLFYFPHLLMKNIDQNHMKELYALICLCKTKLVDERKAGKKDDAENNSEEKAFDAAVNYVERRWGLHKGFAYRCMFCELLAVINIVVQSCCLDIFFHGKFMSLGLLFSAYYSSGRFNDPIKLFPLVTSCYFRRIGESGHVDVVDAYCILPINALNAKIFLFLWVWFSILFSLSLINIIDIFSCFLFSKYRTWTLKIKGTLLNSECGDYTHLLAFGNIGDSFVLSSVKQAMNEVDFLCFVKALRLKVASIEEATSK
ncbi:innexin shaking-B-like [Uloborus diversus]|uniref:innexin shaking-B-like n=1 Tax=Uloborus diversus TaxID=327109 RepID=UPI00240A01C7|nr:innexin shaking-B-like [Uloborus diversus]